MRVLLKRSNADLPDMHLDAVITFVQGVLSATAPSFLTGHAAIVLPDWKVTDDATSAGFSGCDQ
jgi:hypothetical protein